MAHELHIKPYTLCSACYDKSEVDTVLAEKDAEIARLTAALNTSIVDKLTNNKTAEEAKEQQNG